MNLPTPAARKRLHTRNIVCEGFEREDGLFEVELSLVDLKGMDVDDHRRGRIAAGTPFHDMSMRLTIDRDKVIRDVAISVDAAPHLACDSVSPAYRKLIGVQFGAGWKEAVREAVGGTAGCTHLTELLGPAATVAIQTISFASQDLRKARATAGTRPYFVDRCKGWAINGEAVRTLLPSLYEGRPEQNSSDGI